MPIGGERKRRVAADVHCLVPRMRNIYKWRSREYPNGGRVYAMGLSKIRLDGEMEKEIDKGKCRTMTAGMCRFVLGEGGSLLFCTADQCRRISAADDDPASTG
jgi:hypothetical protein